MQKNAIIAAISFAWLVMLSCHANAELSMQPSNQAAGTITQLVQIFTGLERDLHHAIANNDQARIDSLLSTDFEMWNSVRSGEPTPRAEWLKLLKTQSSTWSNRKITQMAVKGIGDNAIVSYKWQGDTDVYIVDIWQGINDNWQLVIRYASEAGNPKTLLPGFDANKKIIEKRY